MDNARRRLFHPSEPIQGADRQPIIRQGLVFASAIVIRSNDPAVRQFTPIVFRAHAIEKNSLICFSIDSKQQHPAIPISFVEKCFDIVQIAAKLQGFSQEHVTGDMWLARSRIIPDGQKVVMQP